MSSGHCCSALADSRTCAPQIKDELEAIHASNILWAVVAMEQPISPRTLEGLAAAAVRTMDSASPSTVAGLLAAARKLEVQPLEGRLVLAALEQVGCA